MDVLSDEKLGLSIDQCDRMKGICGTYHRTDTRATKIVQSCIDNLIGERDNPLGERIRFLPNRKEPTGAWERSFFQVRSESALHLWLYQEWTSCSLLRQAVRQFYVMDMKNVVLRSGRLKRLQVISRQCDTCLLQGQAEFSYYLSLCKVPYQIHVSKMAKECWLRGGDSHLLWPVKTMTEHCCSSCCFRSPSQKKELWSNKPYLRDLIFK